jgi:hypothetical protein
MEGRDTDLVDIVELGEFKLALRALRVAMSFAMPWNMSVLAIVSFLIQNNFCSADFGNADNPTNDAYAVCGLRAWRKQQQVEGF